LQLAQLFTHGRIFLTHGRAFLTLAHVLRWKDNKILLKRRVYMQLRKTILLLLIGCMFLSSSALAAQDGYYTYTESGGNATITAYTDPGPVGDIIIPSKLGGYNTVAIGDSVFFQNATLTSVVFPSTLVSIGNYAFAECTGLTSVGIIPVGVASIGEAPFSSCTGLTSINVDASNLAFISQDGVLYNKDKTVLIQFPAGKTGVFAIPSSVTTIGREAFRFSTHITSITIPDSVTTIGYRGFSRMYALPSVSIPASVTSIGTYGFFGGTSNTGITVHPDNPSFISVDGVLYNKGITELIQYPCGKAGELVIPATVTSIGIAAFELSAKITKITFTGNIETIATAAFESLTGLTSITFPSSLTSIGLGAFAFCSSLTSAYFYGDAPTMGELVFFNCASGFTVYYLDGATGFTDPWYGYPTELFSSGTIRALVREYYLDILDREPDQGGWDYWASEIELIQGLSIYVGEGFQGEAKFFFNSAEYIALNKTDSAFVTNVYAAFLQRPPDQAGLDFWLAQLSAGLTRNMVITQFAYSPEFALYMLNLFGTDTTRPENNLLNDLYRGFLNRFPDNAGYNYWLLQMRIAQCQGPQAVRDLCYQISLLFVGSAEYASRNRNNTEYVEDLYNAILRRGADPAGFQAWVNNLNSGMSRQDVLKFFTDSTEFLTRVNAVIAAGCLP
jgi:hypothetical protein